ncbi:MAG: GatB/YqeY domain-containing protein [Alphaproteobacteria bacterium]|jgi:uncharacterized protein YqeY|nr:GatB/YqeY domain-containing protein [Alphaproteobacteria bacterium]
MIRHRLNEALKAAIRSREERAISTLRLILAAIRDRDIAARGKGNTEGISDDEILGLLQTMIRQRKESIELYEQGGRVDLVEQERGEIALIEQFLPQQMDEAAMRRAIDAVIADLGAGSLKDMGRTMAELRRRYPGRMDFARASYLVKASLQ